MIECTNERQTTNPRDRMQSWRKSSLLVLALALAAGGLSACQNTRAAEGIGFRQARFEKMHAQTNYRRCVEEAVVIDATARTSGGATAQYVASARLLERCEKDLGSHADGSMDEERMRAYALSVQNYLKGGDIAGARTNFENFEEAFPRRDLYYPDGSSFRDSMSLLLGTEDPGTKIALNTYNISRELRSELLRARHWKRN
jgi:predicted small secreted protein